MEQESAARAAKRLKTASPSHNHATVYQNVDPCIPQSHGERSKGPRAANSLTEAAPTPEHDDVEASEHEEDAQGAEQGRSPVLSFDANKEQDVVSTVSLPTTHDMDVPALGSTADEVLTINTQLPAQELGSAIKDPASSIGKQYLALQQQFTLAKQRYTGAAFLSPPDLGLTGSTELGICRKVNLATFVSSLFDGHVSLEVLNDYFLFLFVPKGGTLSKLAASLWVDLKTQAFIASIVTGDQRPPATLLATLFTEDVRQRLLEVRIGFDDLAESEEEFLTNLRYRRAELGRDASKLRERYRWEDFLAEATSYVKILKLHDGALTESERLLLNPRQGAAPGQTATTLQEIVPNGLKSAYYPGYLDTPEESFKHKAARLALESIKAYGQPYFSVEVKHPLIQYSTGVAPDSLPVDGANTEVPVAQPASDVPAKDEYEALPHSSQTAPTLVLLSRARKAYATDPPPITKTQGWTPEEEESLLEELDRAQGALWRKVLENERLKDRSEVQLKDKARSLKLFFLKTGVEVPFFLKEATGVMNDSRSGSAAAA